jgi:hypothetical protein
MIPACLVLAAEVIVFWRKVLFSGRFGIPWDLPYYHQQLAWFAARSLGRGELPLWDPYTYCGIPVYANLTMQLFYPPALAVFALGNLIGLRHLLYLLQWQIALHVLAGGVFTLMLLRRLGTGTAAALAGASVYSLGAYFASQAQHLGAVDAAAWLPLAWLAVVELAERFRWRCLGLLAAALALSFLAGFPAATAVVFGSVFLLALLLTLFRRTNWMVLPACAAAAALAVLMGAVQLFPTLELSRWSVAGLRTDWMAAGGGIPLAALWSLVWADSFGVLHFTDGHWRLPWDATFMYLYCGLPALFFAATALWGRRHSPAPVFAAMAALMGLWMLGDSTPVYGAVVRRLPGAIRGALYAEFALCAFTLAVAVLAGLGADRCLKWGLNGGLKGGLKGRRPIVQMAVVALVALDLIAFGSGRSFNTASLDRDPGIAYEHMDGYAEVPRRVRELTGRNLPPWRIDTMEGSINWTGSAALFEVPTAGGNDPFALTRYMQVRRTFTGGERWGRYYEVRDVDSPLLKLLNVRYVISRGELTRAGSLVKREQLPGNVVYENPNPQPRFFLLGRVRPAADSGRALHLLCSPEFDPRTEAVVEGTSLGEVLGEPLGEPLGKPLGEATGGGSVRVERYGAHQVVLDVETEDRGFLVTSEAYYPGWKASIDGQEAPLRLTNVAFRGLAVPAGRHRVRMWFDPAILKWSAAVSAIGLVLLALACKN